MTLAVALLVDKDLARVEQVARAYADKGLPVAIHVDAKCDTEAFHALQRALSGRKNVVFVERIACGWGEFSLVEAELRLCATILERWPGVSHVQLLSGDSIPVRPLDDLLAYLARHPDTDFIESVSADKDGWIAGGLGSERFTLYFPFSWKTQRKRFDMFVNLQRRLRIARRFPEGISPHIGSQWWCLSRQTLAAILQDPARAEYDRYFARTWIPDESYFQTLARKHSGKLVSHSLVYSHFDHQGKPVIFYDDHAAQLEELENVYFVRKVWAGADRLYARFVEGQRRPLPAPQITLKDQIARATRRRREGRKGVLMMGRAPNRWHEPQTATAAPYKVLYGVTGVFPDIDRWLAERGLSAPHGHLFAVDRVHYAAKAPVAAGGLSSDPNLRDNAVACFLRNFIWQYRNTRPVFHFAPSDSKQAEPLLAGDRNAHIHLVEYGWLAQLAARNLDNDEVLRVAATHLLHRERRFIEMLHGQKARSRVTMWTLGEAMTDPGAVLRAIADSIAAYPTRGPVVLPPVADARALRRFATSLKNIGVDIDLRKLDTGAHIVESPSLSMVRR